MERKSASTTRKLTNCVCSSGRTHASGVRGDRGNSRISCYLLRAKKPIPWTKVDLPLLRLSFYLRNVRTTGLTMYTLLKSISYWSKVTWGMPVGWRGVLVGRPLKKRYYV
ncbi:hypothetical protein PsorP6_004801 [Peronosclerospora sorghi]|uniref:Uncharacterized protein n=1 Tax=Peronosclerospora sorghi TaxID=230839 RepID=A0ACC0VJ16_9STRA|nr:hypothetical protein PsorP6_004801 [Peronosclerospora sorghi]